MGGIPRQKFFYTPVNLEFHGVRPSHQNPGDHWGNDDNEE